MVLLVGGEKGGTGKTTLATNLAAVRAGGRDVLLVDTDKQGSASYWTAIREEHEGLPAVSCVQVFGKSVTNQLQDLAGRYDDLIVDAGGRDSVELRAAMVAADRLVIPMQASQFDAWTMDQMNDLVDQAQAINADLRALVVINRASPHPKVREADELQELLADFENLDFGEVVLHDRIAFRRAASDGCSVLEGTPVDEKAAAEVELLYQTAFDAAPRETPDRHA